MEYRGWERERRGERERRKVRIRSKGGEVLGWMKRVGEEGERERR